MNTMLTHQADRPRSKLAMLALAGGLLGALGAGAATAAPADSETPSVVIHYSDLSLATESGVNTLYRRIVYAAKQVCPEETTGNLAARPVIQACREQAIARAVAQIHNARLAEVYASHSKRG
jgi:UrcA family protein